VVYFCAQHGCFWLADAGERGLLRHRDALVTAISISWGQNDAWTAEAMHSLDQASSTPPVWHHGHRCGR
jgi:hypothetical protein